MKKKGPTLQTSFHREIRERKNNLVNAYPQLYQKFASWGINRETVDMFPIWANEEGNVVMPVIDHEWNVLGECVFADIDQRWFPITQHSWYIGNPVLKSKHKPITICDDIIDVLIAFQLGKDNPVMITKRANPPRSLSNYVLLEFFSEDDELIDACSGKIIVYPINNLSEFFTAGKLLSSVKLIEMDKEMGYERIETNPFTVNGRNYIYSIQNNYVLNDEYERIRTYKTTTWRKLIMDEGIFFINSSAISVEVPGNITKKVSSKYMYESLVAYLSKCFFFLDSNAISVISLYLMYMYTFQNYWYTQALHIIAPSGRHRSIIFFVLKNLIPNTYSFAAKWAWKLVSMFNGNLYWHHWGEPVIIIDDTYTKNIDQGITILTDEKMNKAHASSFVAHRWQLSRLRYRLLGYALKHRWVWQDLPIKAVLADLLQILWNMCYEFLWADDLRAMNRYLLWCRYNASRMKPEEIYTSGISRYETAEYKELTKTEWKQSEK